MVNSLEGVNTFLAYQETMAHCFTWFDGKPSGECMSLLHLVQIVHVIISNNSELQSDSSIVARRWGKSEYLEVCLKFYCGSSSQICESLGHDQSECSTSSSWLEQKVHDRSLMTQQRMRFYFIGNALWDALHRKFLTLLGKDNFQIYFHGCLA